MQLPAASRPPEGLNATEAKCDGVVAEWVANGEPGTGVRRPVEGSTENTEIVLWPSLSVATRRPDGLNTTSLGYPPVVNGEPGHLHECARQRARRQRQHRCHHTNQQPDSIQHPDAPEAPHAQHKGPTLVFAVDRAARPPNGTAHEYRSTGNGLSRGTAPKQATAPSQDSARRPKPAPPSRSRPPAHVCRAGLKQRSTTIRPAVAKSINPRRGATREEVAAGIEDALGAYVQDIAERGLTLPAPHHAVGTSAASAETSEPGPAQAGARLDGAIAPTLPGASVPLPLDLGRLKLLERCLAAGHSRGH